MFLHALTSSENKNETSLKDFTSACSKFGLDCPFPFIRVTEGMNAYRWGMINHNF